MLIGDDCCVCAETLKNLSDISAWGANAQVLTDLPTDGHTDRQNPNAVMQAYMQQKNSQLVPNPLPTEAGVVAQSPSAEPCLRPPVMLTRPPACTSTHPGGAG